MTVFYRKYRPQKLADLVGQESVKKSILAQLESGRIGHGYLFAGPRGSGKTSTARIVAKAVNCRMSDVGNRKSDKNNSRVMKFGEPCNKCDACISITEGSFLDVFEIDAASNRGIDEIRDLREKIKLSPVSGNFKVYIIDEVHMLTTEAFNALLKTLEEPPKHAIFILCTTAPNKLPQTIISRLFRFNFARATQKELSFALEKIANAEKIKIDKEAVAAIAKSSDGSFRDALSLLDQLSMGERITEKEVFGLARISGLSLVHDFLEKLIKKDLKGTVKILDEVSLDNDVSLFLHEVILFLQKVLYIKIGFAEGIESGDAQKAGELSRSLSYSQIQNLMKLFLIALSEIKLYPLPQIPAILAVCRYCGEESADQGGSEGQWDSGTVGRKVGKSVSQMGSESVGQEDGGSAGKSQSRSQSEKSSSFAKAAEDKKESNDEEQELEIKAPAKKSKKTLLEIKENWDKFLEKVKQKNNHVFALLRSSRPIEFDGVNLVVEVFWRFHKDKLEEPKILDMLFVSMSEVLGEPIRIKFLLASKESKPTKTVTVSDVSEIDGDELSVLAKEIFSK